MQDIYRISASENGQSPDEIRAALLESIAKISGTSDRLKRMEPEGHEILDEQIAEEVRETARRGPFRFSQVGIPFGSEIVFIDDPAVKPIVVDDRHIEYLGETTSVSALAQKLKGFDHPVQGTLWFTYQGKRLVDLREEKETQ